MKNTTLRFALLSAALFFVGCPGPKDECKVNTDCAAGQICSANKCVATNIGGGTGGGTTGGGTGGGTTGGGTGGGTTGGGTGGGTTGGGTGGGSTGGGAGGGSAGGGAGGGSAGGGAGGGSAGGGAGTTGGETCAAPQLIGANETVNSTTVGLTSDYSFVGAGLCRGAANTEPDRVFQTTIPANSRLTVTTTQTWDMTLNIIGSPASNCGTGMGTGIVCLAGSDTTGNERATVINSAAAPLDVFILVDGYATGDNGSFVLTTATQAIPPGDVCATALVPDAGTVNGSLVGFTSDYLASTGCASGTSGPDAVWQASVPDGMRLTATVTASSSILADGGTAFGFQPTLNFVVGACASSLTCTTGTAASATSGTTTTTYDNVSGGSQSVLLVVDTPTSAPSGTYTLTTSVDVLNLPVGDICSNVAAPISTNTMLTGQTLVGYTNHFTTGTANTNCTFNNGPDRVYAVTVGAGSRLTLLGNSTTANLAISVVDGAAAACVANPVVCASSVDSNSSTGAETAVFNNATTASKTVLVIVDRSSGTLATDTFDLGISLALIPPAPANDNCAAATALTFTGNTVTVTSDTTEATNGNMTGDAAPTCSSSAISSGRDVVYSYTLAAAQNVTITVTPTSPPATTTFAPVVYVRNNCADATAPNQVGCVANFSSTQHVLSLTQAAGTYFIWVDGSGNSAGPFSMQVTTSAPTPTIAGGETCAAPVVISNNTTFNSTTTGLTNDFAFVDTGLCQGSTATTSTAPDAVFQTSIPANSTLTVSTTATWDRILNVVAAPATNCGAAGTGAGIVCLAGSDSSPETVTVSNTSTSAIDVFIILDGWSAGEGAFQMTTSTAVIPPPGYTKTTVNQACDTLATPTALLSSATTPAIGDDVLSASTALPFAFSFFGTTVANYRVSSNGNLQFFATTGAGSSQFTNVAIPSTTVPNGFVAPFWDDLTAVATTQVRTQIFGSGSTRHMTVEWFDSTFSGSAERLQFQVKVYETTNVIEFHYCSLVANAGSATRILGNSATVGVENLAGSAGVQHSFNTASSVNTTAALRFTP